MMERMPDDDDLLLERLRQRAYDPAWRFDSVYLPQAWVAQRYGKDWIYQRGGCCSNGGVQFPAGSPEAVAFFERFPRLAPFPPASNAELAEAERVIGHRLPELLRRMYTEVANGGFGPSWDGFASITDEYRDPEFSTASAVSSYLRDQKEGLPPWFLLASAGCNCYWYVSLTEPGNPVYYYDWDGWDDRPYDPPRSNDRQPQPPEVGIQQTTPTLAEWLWHWVQGGHIQTREL